MPKKAKTLKIKQIRYIDKIIPAAGSSLGSESHEAWRPPFTDSLVVFSRVVLAKAKGKAEPSEKGREGAGGKRCGRSGAQ